MTSDSPIPDPAEVLRGSVEAIVRAQFEAYRDRRRDDSEALLAPDFTFTSPYDDAISRDDFFARCWPPGDRFVESGSSPSPPIWRAPM